MTAPLPPQPQPPTPPPGQPITRVDAFRRLPTGGTRFERPTGCPEDAFLSESEKRAQEIIRDKPMMPIAAARKNAFAEVFRVWQERHNTELHQARAEAERYRARVDGANLVLWQALRGISDDKPEQAMRLALAILDGLNEQQAGEEQP